MEAGAGAAQILWSQIDKTGAEFVGDSGSGGVSGIVPAPAAGDASKFLKGMEHGLRYRAEVAVLLLPTSSVPIRRLMQIRPTSFLVTSRSLHR